MASPSTSRDIDVEAQPVVLQTHRASEEHVTPECGGPTARQTPIRVEHNQVQSGVETHVQPVADHIPGM